LGELCFVAMRDAVHEPWKFRWMAEQVLTGVLAQEKSENGDE
jgi:hypothetical protein